MNKLVSFSTTTTVSTNCVDTIWVRATTVSASFAFINVFKISKMKKRQGLRYHEQIKYLQDNHLKEKVEDANS